jgi:aquaporin Z
LFNCFAAGGVLCLIASGKAGFDVAAGFASNGYGEHSPGGYSMFSAFVTEVVMTLMFLIIILGATDYRCCPRRDRLSFSRQQWRVGVGTYSSYPI